MYTEFTFKEGILGFETLKRMILKPIEVEFNSTFYELESHEEEVGFLLVDPFKIHSSYVVEINEEIKQNLEIEKTEDVMILTIVSLKDSLNTSTTNLKAPIIFNLSTKKAMQWIDSSTLYSIRNPLKEEA